MPKLLPRPEPDRPYVGKFISFYDFVHPNEKGQCDWCDTPDVPLNVLDGNDNIIVKICQKCERMARMYSQGGFSIMRNLVPAIQQKRKEQIESLH